MTRTSIAIFFHVALLLIVSPLQAQQPGSDASNLQRANQRQAPSPSFVEKIRRYVERKRLKERIFPEEGVYLRIGGLATGGGVAGGVGYRRRVFDDVVFVDVSAAISTRLYEAFDGKVRWIQAWNDRLELWNEFRYRDYPQEDFWGVGGDSNEFDRTNYALRSTDLIGRGLLRFKWLRVGADIGYFSPSVRSGTDSRFPSAEERFSDAQLPGLARQPDFIHETGFVEIDYRDEPGNPRRGGFYRAAYGIWDDHDLDLFDFRRLDASLAQFIPILPEHILALRVGLAYTNNEAGQRVPFYLMPYIGGAETLRGYREFRFHDENVLFVNGEYRWMVIPNMHIAAFFDAGEARPNWESIDLTDLKTSYGFGVRGGTEKRVLVRLDVGAGGNEGIRFFVKFSPSF